MSVIVDGYVAALGKSRARHWVFTLHAAEAASAEDAEAARPVVADAVYLCYQLEKAPTTGRLHFQGLVCFKSALRLAQVRAALGGSPWLAVMRGSVQQAVAYATKDETRVAGPWVLGTVPGGQGSRTDVREFVAAVKRGASDADLIDEHPEKFLRFHNAMNKVRMAVVPARDHLTKTAVYYGPPGSGKTFAATEFDAPRHTYWLSFGNQGQSTWFDGYVGQRTVILDEFFGQLPCNFMCRLSDRYPLSVQLKGGTVRFIAKTVIVTSNLHPSDWWRDGLRAYGRRIGYVGSEREDMGAVVYVGNQEYPKASDWVQSDAYAKFMHKPVGGGEAALKMLHEYKL